MRTMTEVDLLARKRKALHGSEGQCAQCHLRVLAEEGDELCPWCQERKRKEEENAV